MVRDPQIYVEDALIEIALISSLVSKHGKESLFHDPIAYRAAVYSLLKISEACRNIPEEWLKKVPDIRWNAIKAIGNKIRHEYFRLDQDILWDIMTGQLANLAKALAGMRVSDESNPSPPGRG